MGKRLLPKVREVSPVFFSSANWLRSTIHHLKFPFVFFNNLLLSAFMPNTSWKAAATSVLLQSGQEQWEMWLKASLNHSNIWEQFSIYYSGPFLRYIVDMFGKPSAELWKLARQRTGTLHLLSPVSNMQDGLVIINSTNRSYAWLIENAHCSWRK